MSSPGSPAQQGYASRHRLAAGRTVGEIMCDSDVERLCMQIEIELPATWAEWPGGWPGEIEVALIDAVFSIQSRYSGVRNVIGR